MTYFRVRHSWVLAVSVVFSISWCRPGESARGGGDGAPTGTQPFVHSEDESPRSEGPPALPKRQGRPPASPSSVHFAPHKDGTQTPVHRDNHLQAPWPADDRKSPAISAGEMPPGASQRHVPEPPHSTGPEQGQVALAQRNAALKCDITGDEPGLSQQSAHMIYDIPKSYPSPRNADTQQYPSNAYDIPKPYKDSPHARGTQRCDEFYDIPRSSKSAYNSGGISGRNVGGPVKDGAASSPSRGRRQNTAPPESQQPSLTPPPHTLPSSLFDWLRQSKRPARPKQAEPCARKIPEYGAYNTVAGSRPRSSVKASHVGVSRALTFTIPHSLRPYRTGDGLQSSVRAAGDADDSASQLPKERETPRRFVEIIDPPEETPKPEIIFEGKEDCRGFFAHLRDKMRLSSSRRRNASKSQTCAIAGSSERDAEKVSSKSKDAAKRAKRALPPIPVASRESRLESEQATLSLDGTLDPDAWDSMIRRELSPQVLEAVLFCERRILEALQTGSLMELLSQEEAIEEFKFFVGIVAHFAKGLKLTPAEHLFIMWAEECSAPSSRCPVDLLLEMIPVYEFVTGMGPLQVPPAVRILLSSGDNEQITSSRRVQPPVPAAGGTAVRAKLPDRPFTLFFHRISSDPVRKQTVEQLVESWSQFTTEVKYLLFFTNLEKSLDYPEYRTRFTIYAYTVSAVKLHWERKTGMNPVDLAVHDCFTDLLFVRRMAQPNFRGTFTEKLRRNYLNYIRSHAGTPS